MNYKETLDYLFSQLPMFQRVGAAAYKPNLDNTYALLQLLDNPHKHFKSVHIAGTNGKGSVSHMLASVLQEAGYKTGLYTSPHLKDFRERIRIDGKMIPEDYVVEFVEKYREGFEKLEASFFELSVGMAFKYFEEEKVDIAILEAGMGGRLDSTNVVNPKLSVITNISYDHMAFLGDSLEKIASEKAGIIKRNIPLVIGELQEETEKVFIEKANEKNAPVSFADQNISIHTVEEITRDGESWYKIELSRGGRPYLQDIQMPLTGFYQLKNLITALQASETLAQQAYKITPEAIRKGIAGVKENTGFTGRWLVLDKSPLTICDTGHNEEGIRSILSQIRSLSFDKLHIVWGMVNDKDIDKILRMMPKEATYYFCKADIPRGLDAAQLQKSAQIRGLRGESWPSVRQAVDAAKSAANGDDLIFIGGSTFVVAEVV